MVDTSRKWIVSLVSPFGVLKCMARPWTAPMYSIYNLRLVREAYFHAASAPNERTWAPCESRQQPRKKLDQLHSLFSRNGTNIFLFRLVHYDRRRSDRQCRPIFRQSQLGSSVSCLLVGAAYSKATTSRRLTIALSRRRWRPRIIVVAHT